MIAIFTVLGLLLFGGGAYAIYDGWPYLVLERGFTEVIIGSIASSAGVIMLSLAWVLREVRATRRALVEAIELRSAIPIPAAQAAEAPPVSLSRTEDAAFSRSVAPVAIGAVAGAAATSAVAQALAVPEDETASAPAEAPGSSGDRDLFGALVTQNLQEPEPAAENELEATPEPAQIQCEEAGPLPDMFEEVLSTPPLQPVAFEAEGHEAAEPAAADVEPQIDQEPFGGHDAPFPFGDRASEQPAEEHAAAPVAAEALAATGNEAGLDEFSALRESLAGHLNEPEPATGRVEPSFAQEPDPFAAAETWMDRASPRREPWLDTPPAAEEAPAEAEAPLWPPRTEAYAFDAPVEPAAGDAETEAVSDAVDPPLRGNGSDAGNVEPEPATEPVEVTEPQAEAAPVATDSRQASDEGIVGAYQVGDAHFTIFADGSIRARTPDGEYSFASMDELKVYLASEKSRLGV